MYVRTKFSLILLILLAGISIVLGTFYIESRKIEKISAATTQALLAIKSVEKVAYDLSNLANAANKEAAYIGYSRDKKVAEKLLTELKNNTILSAMQENSEIGAFFYVMLDNWKNVPALMAEVEEKYNQYLKTAKETRTIPFSEAAEVAQFKEEIFDTYSAILKLSSYLRDKVIYNSDIIIEELRINMKRTIQEAIALSFSLSAFTSIVVVILILVLSARIVKRMRDLGTYADKLSAGDFSYRMQVKSHDEIAELTNRFNLFVNGLKKNIDAVLDFTRTLGIKLQEELNINQLYSIIATSIHKHTRATASAVCIIEENYLVPVAIDGLFPAPFEPKEVITEGDSLDDPFLLFHMSRIPITHPLFSRALSGEEILIKEEKEYNGEKISSLAILPLRLSRRILGVICAVTSADKQALSDLDVVHLKTFADYTAITLDNHIKYQQLLEQQKIRQDMALAKEIQQELLPSRLIQAPGWSVAALYRPLWEISGDYFDIITLKDKSTLVILCDVAGKGISASLVMVMIRTIFRLIATTGKTPAEMLGIINTALVKSTRQGVFATMSIIKLSPSDNTIEYSTAAHLPAIIIDEDSTVKKLDTGGLPLGLELTSNYQNIKLEILTGSTIVLYTDGITEANNIDGTQMGEKGLIKILQKHRHNNPQKMIKSITEEIENFTHGTEASDDQTLLIIKPIKK